MNYPLKWFCPYWTVNRLYQEHLFNDLLTLTADQPIAWQQLTAFRHVEEVKHPAEVQTEHQNGEERGFKWLWTCHGCWCQTGWSEHVRNSWSAGIYTHNHLWVYRERSRVRKSHLFVFSEALYLDLFHEMKQDKKHPKRRQSCNKTPTKLWDVCRCASAAVKLQKISKKDSI